MYHCECNSLVVADIQTGYRYWDHLDIGAIPKSRQKPSLFLEAKTQICPWIPKPTLNSSLTFTLHRVTGKPGLNCLLGHYTPDIKATGHVSNIPFTYIIPFSLILSSLLICSTCTSSPRTRISDTLFPSSDKTIFTLISSFLDAFVQ